MPITIYAIVNVEHTDRIIEGLRFVFIELPKFKPKTIVEKSAFNDAQLYAYEQFWDAVYVEKALIEGGYDKGRTEGIEEANRENARKMKAKGYKVDDIAEITGLPVSEIDAL